MSNADVELGQEIEVLSLDDVAPYEDTDDPNLRAHIVNPPDNPHLSYGNPKMTGQMVVDIARLAGIEIVALCGHRFVPKHNPDKPDVCQPCFKVAEQIMRELGE